MATDAEQIALIRSQTLALITSITTSPKPSYTIDGQEVLWADYLARLQSLFEWCNQQANTAEPFEISSRAYT